MKEQGVEANDTLIREIIEGGKYYIPVYYGVGYAGEMGTAIQYDSVIFKTWLNMLRRCYHEPVRESYRDVTVCEEWQNFTNFHRWMSEHMYDIDGEHTQLDKDILIPGNREYGPEACLIVPATVNRQFCRNNSKLTPAAIRRYIDMYRGLVPEKVITAMDAYAEWLEAAAAH